MGSQTFPLESSHWHLTGVLNCGCISSTNIDLREKVKALPHRNV
jgi:hypothetical protein